MAALTVLGYLVALVGTYLLNGWALSVLWGWFVRPTFHLPALGLAQAIGLSIVVGFFTGRGPTGRKQTKAEIWVEPLLISILVALGTLGIGWIVHLFMGGAS